MICPGYTHKVRGPVRSECLTNDETAPVKALNLPRATSKSLRYLLLQSSVASIALLAIGGTRADAACVETAPGSGVFDCSGTGPGPDYTGQSVTINADATASFTDNIEITGPGTSTLNNNGTLTNGLVATDNDRFTLNNQGLIDGNILLQGTGTNIILNLGAGTVQNGCLIAFQSSRWFRHSATLPGCGSATRSKAIGGSALSGHVFWSYPVLGAGLSSRSTNVAAQWASQAGPSYV